jgi:hypothetical protein
LEQELAGDIDVPAIALGLDALICAYERADDERGRLAYRVERPELKAHRVLLGNFFSSLWEKKKKKGGG